ncbi:MAG TPA: DUF5681 domain-containing protein [Stellaceae bacterium]|nr:DUF5681 domain-containing protein [Stellaceae bacterium]
MADRGLQKQPEQRKPKRGGPGRPFEKGRSGNPAGRPPGLRNRASQIAETLLAGEAEALTRKAVEQALAGDGAALRLCLERLLAPCRERPMKLALPPVRGPADLAPMMEAVVAAVGAGGLTGSEAGELSRLVEAIVRAVAASDFEQRLRALEGGDPAGS